MKTTINTSLLLTLLSGILFCSCSDKDDIIIAAPNAGQSKSPVVASSSSIKTKQTISAAELENRFKGCKAHW